MDAVKFVEERRRMFAVTGENPKYSLFNMNTCAEDVVKEVEEWSAAHPRKTRQSVFLEHYPKADVLNNGVISLCPKLIEGYNPSAGCYDTDCYDCKTEYWMQEVE
jgi:hypothetical protein